MTDSIKYKYVGSGHYFQGVPARDLTEVDWAKLDEAQRQLVEGGGLYQKAEPKRKAKKD